MIRTARAQIFWRPFLTCLAFISHLSELLTLRTSDPNFRRLERFPHELGRQGFPFPR